jgi:NAD(P)-dependent dehydrogenase (short-subunit alcohol dehydrogenase family)
MSKNKVLIFGSNGTLSKEIIKLLIKKFEIIKINKNILNFDKKKMHLKVNYILSKCNPDVVINSSGVLGNNSQLYEKVFNTNFGSNWEIIKYYLKKKINKKIKIILIGSTAYKSGKKNYLLYSSSKSALHNLCLGAKETLNEKNIKLIIYHPKRMKTKMIKNLPFINKNSGVNSSFEAKKICKLV